MKTDVRVSGKIGASLDAAAGYIAQKEQERAERIEAYRAWRVEEATYIPPSEPAPDLQAGLQALYEGRKAGEALTEASFRALGMDIEAWKQYHLWQGLTNDCGPTNIAMMLNAFSGQPGLFTRETIGEEMYQGWQRVPQELYVPTDWKSVLDKNTWKNVLETAGGATPPWGMVTAFNQRAVSSGIDWRASLQSNGTKEDLLEHLQDGQPVTVLIVRGDGSAHYETVIGYDPDADEIIALDPLKDQGIIKPQGWGSFNDEWSGESLWWAGIKNDMIIYTPITPTPAVPDAIPAPEPPTPAPSTPPSPQKSE